MTHADHKMKWLDLKWSEGTAGFTAPSGFKSVSVYDIQLGYCLDCVTFFYYDNHTAKYSDIADEDAGAMNETQAYVLSKAGVAV